MTPPDTRKALDYLHEEALRTSGEKHPSKVSKAYREVCQALTTPPAQTDTARKEANEKLFMHGLCENSQCPSRLYLTQHSDTIRAALQQNTPATSSCSCYGRELRTQSGAPDVPVDVQDGGALQQAPDTLEALLEKVPKNKCFALIKDGAPLILHNIFTKKEVPEDHTYIFTIQNDLEQPIVGTGPTPQAAIKAATEGE